MYVYTAVFKNSGPCYSVIDNCYTLLYLYFDVYPCLEISRKSKDVSSLAICSKRCNRRHFQSAFCEILTQQQKEEFNPFQRKIEKKNNMNFIFSITFLLLSPISLFIRLQFYLFCKFLNCRTSQLIKLSCQCSFPVSY